MARKTIELRKTGATGATQVWRAEVDGNTVTYTWGQLGGAMQTEKKTYSEGKNVGRANERTPEEQCMFEAARKARKKVEKGYWPVEGGELIGEQKSATVVDHSEAAPFCMLAETLDRHVKKLDAYEYVDVQPKLDGNRCLVNISTGELYSRSRKPITSIPGLGEEVAERCKNLAKRGVKWVDGELYSDELTFNEIQSVVRKKEPHWLAGKIKFNMYDALADMKWKDRRRLLETEVRWGGRLGEVETKTIPATYEAIEEASRDYVERGYEGAIVRLHDGEYINRRTHFLLKHKTFKDAEYKVVGFQCEKNARDRLGAVVLATEDGKEFSARPAMTDAEKQEIWDDRVSYLGRMATVKFQELDGKSGIPRFPVLKGFRAENDIEEGRRRR